MTTFNRESMSLYEVPDQKKIRVIIDTDAACEADDPFAICQALLTEKFIVKGIIAEHFLEENSLDRSYDIIKELLETMNMDVPIFKGQKGPISQDTELSEGAKFLIAEAQEDDSHPLYVLTMGALSTVGMALRECPEIGEKLTFVVTGGVPYENFHPPIPGYKEFNFGNDVEAANVLISSKANVRQIPMSTYSKMNISFAELEYRIAQSGKTGRFMFDNMVRLNNSEKAFWTMGESWSLGDSPAAALAANPGCGQFHMESAREILLDTNYGDKLKTDKKIMVYDTVDSRYVIEDLVAKLMLFEKKRLAND